MPEFRSNGIGCSAVVHITICLVEYIEFDKLWSENFRFTTFSKIICVVSNRMNLDLPALSHILTPIQMNTGYIF